MRGKIRLDGRKHVETKQGFPVIIYLSKDSKEKVILTGFHSKKTDWDAANALPKKQHPDFINLLNYLEILKIRLLQLLNKSKYDPISFSYAEFFLKGAQRGVFFTEAMELAKNLCRTYRVAIISFNKHFPDYPYDYITKSTAVDYMNILLNQEVNGRKRSPNGVRSYMNCLTAVWNKLGAENNPFSGVKPAYMPTKSKALTDVDLKKISNNNCNKHPNSKGGGVYNYLNYFLLCFYLGGIDLVDLANLKTENVVNGRIEFNRSKGGTNVFVSNKIFPQALIILQQYDCKPYLIPLKKYNNYDAFLGNISRIFGKIKTDLDLSKKPYSKAPRYTFINRAKELLIDERICIEIVGHSQSSTHSIYKDEFPLSVRDAAHLKIITL